MDFYQEQHSYTLARNASIDHDSDEDTSWVMLTREGEVIKLPGEKIYYKVRSRIGLDITTPKSLPNASAFSVKSDNGILYITNNRVIYLPARPTETFKSFSAPILDFEDTRVASSFFGPWSWIGLVKPTVGGGVPTDIPRLEIKLTFKEGGHDVFQSNFEVLKERLNYARTLQQETGQMIPTGEDLPKYEATQSGSSSGPVGQGIGSVSGISGSGITERGTGGASTSAGISNQQNSTSTQASGAPGTASSTAAQVSQSTPDEPPPDYEEAQAQAIGMRLEETMREAADRQ